MSTIRLGIYDTVNGNIDIVIIENEITSRRRDGAVLLRYYYDTVIIKEFLVILLFFIIEYNYYSK